MYTTQSYYDELVCRAIDGSFPCHDERRNCRYRTKEGNKCAAGILIPDNKYIGMMEGSLADDDLVFNNMDIPGGMSLIDVREIQSTYDGSTYNWNPVAFVRDLNNLDCFYDVKKVFLKPQK